MKEFKVIRNYYEKDSYIYTTNKVEFMKGITILVGCNGSGKSTLIEQIKAQCKEQNITVYEYDNKYDGGNNSLGAVAFREDFSLLSSLMTSSEGEEVMINFGNASGRIGSLIRGDNNIKELFLLFDGIDSGVGVDGALEYKSLFKLIEKDCDERGIDVYIIVAANTYEMVRLNRCMDVKRLKYLFGDEQLTTYDKFRRFIIKSRKEKDKRYKVKHPFDLK